jgi:hypothetical protein
MKKLFFFSALLFLAFHACRNNQSSAENASNVSQRDTANFTRIQWSDTLIDFGTIKMGDSVQVKFQCTNIGTKPLFLTGVRASCGCTIPSYTKSAILPGENGIVTASFNSNKSHPGDIYKTVYVTSNTPGGDNYVLTFTGKIVQPVQ